VGQNSVVYALGKSVLRILKVNTDNFDDSNLPYLYSQLSRFNSGLRCRLCKENVEDNNLKNGANTSSNNCSSVSAPRVFFELCTSCTIKKFDPEDDFGREFGECRECVKERKERNLRTSKHQRNPAHLGAVSLTLVSSSLLMTICMVVNQMFLQNARNLSLKK